MAVAQILQLSAHKNIPRHPRADAPGGENKQKSPEGWIAPCRPGLFCTYAV